MKIACISDLHRQHHFVDFRKVKADVLVIAGDYDILGSIEQCVGLMVGLEDWLKGLKKQFKHVVMIAGNHDFGLEAFEITGTLKKYCHYLNDSGVTIDGVKFWGSPITPMFNDWAFMKERGTPLKRQWAKIPANTEVLVTHGPPLGIMDKLQHSGERVGDKQLLDRIKELKDLKLHVFGHIHEGYGKLHVDNVTHVNASVLNENYVMQNKPIVVKIKAGTSLGG